MINVQKHSPNLVETKIPIRIAVEPAEKQFSGLKILIDEHKLHFASVDDFSFAIESRTSICDQQFEEILRTPRENLWRNAKILKDNEKSLIAVLETSLKDPRSVKDSIQRLGIEIFRHEHQWREIFGALLRRDDVDEYLRTALVKYLQYLASYQEIVRLAFALDADSRSLPQYDGSHIASHETALFDVLQFNDAGRMVNPFQRLPQGEPVTLYALPGHSIDLLLAKYSFRLVNNSGWTLYDPADTPFRLQDGHNMVGRGPGNDISLASEFGNISRKHVIFEPLDDHAVLIVDLSSHGTFVPPRQVELDSYRRG